MSSDNTLDIGKYIHFPSDAPPNPIHLRSGVGASTLTPDDNILEAPCGLGGSRHVSIELPKNFLDGKSDYVTLTIDGKPLAKVNLSLFNNNNQENFLTFLKDRVQAIYEVAIGNFRDKSQFQHTSDRDKFLAVLDGTLTRLSDKKNLLDIVNEKIPSEFSLDYLRQLEESRKPENHVVYVQRNGELTTIHKGGLIEPRGACIISACYTQEHANVVKA